MFKILIVDDELIILNGIKMMLENCEELDFPMDIVTAPNVPSAMEILSHFHPDLLLADITMPVMNGFDLIRYIREQNLSMDERVVDLLSMDIVILTSHANFDYAQEAIRLQISDYLLKPVNLQTLIQTVQASRQKKEMKENALKQQTLLSLRAMMLYDIPFSELFFDPDVIQELFPHAYFSVAVFKPGFRTVFSETGQLNQIFSSFYDIYYPMPFTDRQEYVFVCNHEQFSIKAAALRSALSDQFGTSDFFLGLSITSNSCESLYHLYTNALQRIFYQQVFPDDAAWAGASLFTYKDCVEIFLSSSPEAIRQSLHPYIQKLNTISSSETDRTFLSQVWKSFFMNMRFYLNSMSICFGGVLLDEPLPETVCDTSSLTEAIMLKTELIKKELKNQESKTEQNAVIPYLIRYIKKNYQKDLSLIDLAEEVHLNPNYLSGLFKKTTSCSYLEYLHHERISVAKKLLSDTDLNMEQIAHKVGYNSSVQLLRIFKKYEHMLPSDYRSLCQRV